jgi:hypothetical protein
MHGARAGAPIKHGRYSRSLKDLGLSRRFDAAFEDPEILSHRTNVALLEVLICETFEGSLPPNELWQEARRLYEKAAGGERDVNSFRELGSLLKQGVQAANAIDKAVGLMECQGKHQVREWKREKDLRTTLTARQANMLMAAFIALIEEFVPRDRMPEAGRRFNSLIQDASGR